MKKSRLAKRVRKPERILVKKQDQILAKKIIKVEAAQRILGRKMPSVVRVVLVQQAETVITASQYFQRIKQEELKAHS